MCLPLSMWGVELVAFLPPKKKMQAWLLQTRSCVINLFFPSIKQNLFICLLLFFEQVNFGRLSFFSPRRTARSGGQNLGALIKNVAGVPARQTSATGAVEKRLFFYIYIIIYLSLHPTPTPTPPFPSIFHLPFCRWASPWPISRRQEVCLRTDVWRCEWMYRRGRASVR